MNFDTQNAECLFQQRSISGRVTILQNSNFRWLEFGNHVVQSAYMRQSPDTLILDYTQWMLSAMLLMPQPQHALLMGLGGGSLAHALAQMSVDVDLVEYDSIVVDACERYFPFALDRERVVAQDAQHCWLQLPRNYPMIFVDLFSHDGYPDWLCTPAFYDQCRAQLTTDGVLALNTNNYDELAFESLLEAVYTVFDGHLFTLRVPRHDNIIVLAINNAEQLPEIAAVSAQAHAWGSHLGVPWPRLVRALVARHGHKGQLQTQQQQSWMQMGL